MKFVGCHCEGVLPLPDRLYAFPRKPEDGGLVQGMVILDSGAYGLSRRGGRDGRGGRTRTDMDEVDGVDEMDLTVCGWRVILGYVGQVE